MYIYIYILNRKKRERYEEFLKKVPLFQTMDTYERTQLADVLGTKEYQAGDYIITEVRILVIIISIYKYILYT